MYYIEFTWKSKLLADLQSRSSGFRIISSQSYQQICKKPSLKWERLWQNIFIYGPSKEENGNQNFYCIAFCYYPLVLMLPSRGLKKISILFMKNPKNYIWIQIYSFQNLLKKDNIALIHQRNLQLLATKIFKAYNDTDPELLNNVFKPRITLDKLKNYDSTERFLAFSDLRWLAWLK